MAIKGTPEQLADLQSRCVNVRAVNLAAIAPKPLQTAPDVEATPNPPGGKKTPRRGRSAKKTDIADLLADQCRLAGLPVPERDVPLVVGRKWLWDCVWANDRLCVEVHGGLHARLAHSTAEGVESDMEKRNALVLQGGWRQLDFSAGQVRSGYALKVITQVLTGVHAKSRSEDLPRRPLRPPRPDAGTGR
jgi:very-short-patch-repair endonuclease